MKNNKCLVRKCIIFGILVCIININSIVFATSKKCNVEICITDKTGGQFSDEVKVTLLNIDGSNAYDYTILPENYRSSISINEVIQQDNYMIAISYPNKDSYTITEQSGNEITQFVADTDKETINWIIQSNELVEIKSNSEYKEIWNKFLNRALEIETNSEYKGILKYYSDLEKVFSEQYIKIYKDATVDDYLNLSTAEQFLYHTTYILPVRATTYGQYDLYLESWDKFNTYVIGGTNSVIECFGGQAFLDEYQAVMKWQYDYFTENSAFYNFMTGEDSHGRKIDYAEFEENNSLIDDSNTVNKQDDNSNKEDSVNDEEKNDDGIWNEFLKNCKSNIMSIAILIILSIIVMAVSAYKRYKSIQDEE